MVGKLVGVLVGMLVDVLVGMLVGVLVGILVGMLVGVLVGVLVSVVGGGGGVDRGQKCRIPSPPSARSRTDTRAMTPLTKSGTPEAAGPAGAGVEGG